MNIYGFIVGIEKYAQLDWSVPGPCGNAIAIAEWLFSIGVPAKQIHLFLWPMAQDLDKKIAEMAAADFDVRRAGNSDSIDEFWRVELTKNVPPGSKLLVFWSGHGCTSPRQNRVFFCGDYESALPTRVFNGTDFLAQLLTPNYERFSEQVILADVCGVYANSPVQESSGPPDPRKRSQLAYFATPEGDYAKGEEGRGVFTNAVLNVLKTSGGWPKHKPFVEMLDKALDQLDAPAFRIAGFSEQGAIRESLVGRAKTGGNAHFQMLFELLAPLDVVESVFRPHYLRTVTSLGNPALAKAQGLVGALKELSSMRDLGLANAVPRGLLQFLVRLASEENLRKPIESWLDEHASAQKATLAELRSELELEAGNKVLFVFVEVDPDENVTQYKTYLCNIDFSLVPGWKFEPKSVLGWKDFERSLQELLAEFVADDRLSNLELHFVVDAPLFDRPFHLIPLGPGKHAIGEDVVVVLRHRQRILSNDQKLKQAWRESADKLRSAKPAKLKWLKLTPGKELPAEKGLFFATFTFPVPIDGKPASRGEKEIVQRLLKLGTPYVYLPQGVPKRNPDRGKDGLNKLLSLKRTLNEFPTTFLAERIRGTSIAAGGTIIWDDPESVPLSTIEGVRFG